MAKVDLTAARETYPSLGMDSADWMSFFRTSAGEAAMGRIIYDIYDEVLSQREKAAGVRRIGRRPARSAVSLQEVLDVVFVRDFNNEPLTVVLPKLMGKQSQRSFAAQIPMAQASLNRLLRGEKVSDLRILEAIAHACDVHPWFFPEWRALFLSTLVADVLTESPQVGIGIIRAMRDRTPR